VAIYGNNVVIGAPLTDVPFLFFGSIVDAGEAYVYTRYGSTWTQTGQLTPDNGLFTSDQQQGEHFGSAVAISAGRVVVGAPLWDEAKSDGLVYADVGRVFVFEQNFGAWVRTARLTADGGLPIKEALLEGNAGDHFGAAVASNGAFVAVGAPGYDGTAIDEGAAYVFYKLPDLGSGNGASWARGSGPSGSGRLNAALPAGADPQTGIPAIDQYRTADSFGTSIALGNGRLVIGMPGFNEINAGGFTTRADLGAVRTYSTDGVLPTAAASYWAETLADPKDQPNQTPNGGSHYGSVTYYDPNSRELFVSDPGQNAIYVYVNEGLNWRKVQTITSPDTVYITAAGLTAQYYNFGGALSVMPSFGGAAANTRTEWAVNYGVGAGSFAPGVQADHFAVRWTGQIESTFTQNVTFYLGSDDGSQLYIDGNLYINANQLQGFTSRSATVNLAKGVHNIDVRYFENEGGAGLTLSYSAANGGGGTLTGPIGKDIKVDGNNLLIGAPDAKAFVYQRYGELWGEQQELDGAGGFGRSVAISGNKLVIGMPLANATYASIGQPDSGYNLDLGAPGGAVVYSFNGSSWYQDRLLMPDDSALPYDTSYSNTITPAGEGQFALRIYDNSTWYYFGPLAAGTTYSLDFNTPQGNIQDNTVEVRVGPNTHIKLIDSGLFGDNTLDVYNYNYSDYAWFDVPFIDGWQGHNNRFMRNNADKVQGNLIGPASITNSGDNYFSGLSGAQWGSSVAIVGNTVYVGAQGASRAATYNLAYGDYTHWTATIGSVTDTPLRSTSYLNGAGALGAEMAVNNASDIWVGQPGSNRVQEITKYGNTLSYGNSVGGGTGFGSDATVEVSGNRMLDGATGGAGQATLYTTSGSFLQTLQPYYYDKVETFFFNGHLFSFGTGDMQVDTNSNLHFGAGPQLISEGFAVVGTNNTDLTANQVYNYRQRGSAWTPVANDLLVPEQLRTSKTGSSVAIDGSTAVVGARDYDNRGAVFVFTQVSGTDNWQLQATIQPKDITHDDQFGQSVALSGDSLIVGAPNKVNGEGAVYMYQRLGNAWVPKSEFLGSANSELGHSVAVFGDSALAGAPGANMAFFYAFNGTYWSTTTVVVAPDGMAGDFGYAVTLDQSTAAIGAPVGVLGHGGVEIYTQSGRKWAAQQTITASTGVSGDFFGGAVDLSGGILAVGAPFGNNHAGEVFTYERDSSGIFTDEKTLSLFGGSPFDLFGLSVAIDGTELIVGVPGKTRLHGAFEGEAVSYRLKADDTWQLETAVDPLFGADALGGDEVGYSVALSGDMAIIGAPQFPGRSTFTPGAINTDGAGYVFIRQVSPPVTVTQLEEQDVLIAGAKANIISGTVGGVQTADLKFFDITNVTLQTGAGDDHVTVNTAGLTAFGLLNFTVNMDGGNDTLTELSDPLKTPLSGTLLPTGNFGTAQPGDPLPQGAGYTPLSGVFLFNGGAGNNTMIVQADCDWTLDTNTLTAGNGDTMDVTGVQTIRITGGSGMNRLKVINWAGTVTLDGAGGADEYMVSAQAMGHVKIEDSGSATDLDQLTVLGTTDNDAFLISSTQVALNGQTSDYSGIEVIRVAGLEGNDKFDVVDASAAKVILDGGEGSDTYNVYTGTSTASVYIHDTGSLSDNDKLNVPAAAVAGSNQFTVGSKTVFYDSSIETIGLTTVSPILSVAGTTGDDTITLTSTTLTINSVVFDLTGVIDLTINGLAGDDTFDIIGVPSALTGLHLIGGDGTDAIFGPAASTVWHITGTDAGDAAGAAAFDFSQIESLVGGAGADDFVFANNGARLDGDINGAGGNNTLDYSALTLAVSVELETDTATGIGGNFLNIGTLIGSAAPGTLIGSNSGDVWTITGANSGTVGSVAFSSFANLTGGTGNDTFTVSDGASVGGTIDGGGGLDALLFNTSDANDSVSIGAPMVAINGIETRYINIDTLTVNTLGGSDTVGVNEAVAGFAASVNVNSGEGDDAITINLMAGTASHINVDGGAPSASDSLTVVGTSGDDTIAVNGTSIAFDSTNISTTGIENLTVSAGDGNDSLTLTGATASESVQLLGQGGDDSITLNYPVVTGAVSVDGGDGTNTLTVNLTSGVDTATVTATTLHFDSGAAVAYSNIAVLALNTLGGNDIVTIDDTNAATMTTLDTGAGDDQIAILGASGSLVVNAGDDNDTIQVQQISAATTINAGTGDDTVNVGIPVPGMGGLTSGIGAVLTVNGGGGSDVLNVDDSADGTGRVGDLSSSELSGLGMTGSISYTGLDALNISLGSGDDNFTIASTHNGATTVRGNAGDDTINVRTLFGATTVDAGSGNDTINVGSQAPATGGGVGGIAAALLLIGGDGSDTINVDDSGDPVARTGTLTATTLTGLGMAGTITYTTVEALNISLGLAADTFVIAGTNAGTNTVLNANGGDDTVDVLGTSGAVRVDTGAGNDTINVGSLAPTMGGTVNGIGSALTISGGAGNDTLNVDDTGDVNPNAGMLTANTLTGLGLSAGIHYGNLETLVVSLGSGGNTFKVAGTMKQDDFRTQTLVNTGIGDDHVTVSVKACVDGPLAVNLEAGNDYIDASRSTLGVTIFGGDGSDTILGGAGSDVLFGDRGVVDYFNSNGQLVTRLGIDVGEQVTDPADVHFVPNSQTDGDFKVSSTISSREPMAGSFNDFINAGEGQNIVIGGSGNDTLKAGHGDNIIFGDNGSITFFDHGLTAVIQSIDSRYGGNDQISVGCGDNIIIGGVGADIISAGDGNNIIMGDDGQVTLHWHAENSGHDDAMKNDVDLVLVIAKTIDPGVGGADKITVGSGHNVLFGGPGNDLIKTGRGGNIIFAGNGQVTFGKAEAQSAPPKDGSRGGVDKMIATDINMTVPVVDWSDFFGGNARLDKADKGDGSPLWLDDFLNHLGQTAAERNPNADIRVRVDAMA
jgi:Ca2+-binding RTX toxin-like protein